MERTFHLSAKDALYEMMVNGRPIHCKEWPVDHYAMFDFYNRAVIIFDEFDRIKRLGAEALKTMFVEGNSYAIYGKN